MFEADSRKRPLSDQTVPVPAKKRALTDTNGSPTLVNGIASTPTPPPLSDEPKDQDNLEQFRKEAIFRRMKHYSRENDRNKARVAELERLKGSYEASVVVMGACWAQIVETIRDLLQPPDQAVLAPATEALLKLARRSPPPKDEELHETIDEKAHATRRLVSSLLQVSGVPLAKDDVYARYQKAQSEVTALHSQLVLLENQLDDSREQREALHAELVASNTRFDRLSSRTVQASLVRKQPGEDQPKEEGHVDIKSEERMKEPVLQASLPPAENAEALQQAQDRVQALEESKKSLEDEVESLKEELRVLKQETKTNIESLSQDALAANPFVLSMVSKAAALAERNKELLAAMESRQRDFEELKTKYEEEVKALEANNAMIEANFKALVDRRDEDLARIRRTRDEAIASHRELKHREESLFDLARLEVALSELARVKSLLAAQAGDEDLVAFFAREKSGDISYVDSLKERLAHAESEVAVLRSTLENLDATNPDLAEHIRSEADVRRQLAEVSNLLARYKATYGESSTLPPETHELSERLQDKEGELKALKLQVAQREQAESELYGELDKLTTAWESAEQHLKSKVFDLSSMEQQLRKINVEKAKLENKLYAAITAKDAALSEMKTFKRTGEKEQKIIATLQEAKKVQDQLVTQTKAALVKAEAHVDALSRREAEIRRKAAETETDLAQATHRLLERNALYTQVAKDLSQCERQRRKAEEELKVVRKEADRLRESLKSNPTATSQKEAELQKEVKNCYGLLKCSTCGLNIRNTYLTKCSHSFCRQCIDSRIATRQRKCPACNLAFGAGDVQHLYFQ
ncbi:hypothetical protein K488DRAFT_86539 [Vararia minispora EC-137]|uniref:Uncharacterized protein n=1 Tax=Vararia minispora EC-137 TaxID=1314806 RepID=A0ACB8QIV7_9AGAM|nr:hypothetical protein K488DRAFT_86539 [Vararia minispora EC-137]